MTDTPNNDDESPCICFGGNWIPAYEVWDKIETSSVVLECIHRYNQKWPDLATALTRDMVPVVRKRLGDIQIRLPARPIKTPELEQEARKLLKTLSPEDVVDTLVRDHDWNGDMLGLIYLAGVDAYTAALLRETSEFEFNRIAPEQAAGLWNEWGRPVPGGGLWSAPKIQKLMDVGNQ